MNERLFQSSAAGAQQSHGDSNGVCGGDELVIARARHLIHARECAAVLTRKNSPTC